MSKVLKCLYVLSKIVKLPNYLKWALKRKAKTISLADIIPKKQKHLRTTIKKEIDAWLFI